MHEQKRWIDTFEYKCVFRAFVFRTFIYAAFLSARTRSNRICSQCKVLDFPNWVLLNYFPINICIHIVLLFLHIKPNIETLLHYKEKNHSLHYILKIKHISFPCFLLHSRAMQKPCFIHDSAPTKKDITDNLTNDRGLHCSLRSCCCWGHAKKKKFELGVKRRRHLLPFERHNQARG